MMMGRSVDLSNLRIPTGEAKLETTWMTIITARIVYSRRKTRISPKKMWRFLAPENGSRCLSNISLQNIVRRRRSYRETFRLQMLGIIVVRKRWQLVVRQVGNSVSQEDDGVQEGIQY